MENVMLFDKRKELIKIVDFGLSNIYNDENPMRTQCGSPEYAAPELFVKNYKYGPEVDLWSLGVILYVVCSGRLPFLCPKDGQVTLEERRRRLLAQINHGLGPHQERAIIALSSEYKHLVSRLLTPATNKRMGLTELCQHPWIAGCKFFKNHSSQKKFNQLKRDHHTVIEEIIGLANLNRDAIEINVANKRYGKVGGMYNILNKFVQSKLNNIVTEKCTRKAKTSNDLEVKTDNTTKNEVNKALNKTIPLKTHKVFMRRKNKITNFQPTENKPMTQPCSKKSLTCAPYMSSKSFRSQKQPHLAISSREKPTITEERTNKGSLRKSRLTNSISSPIKTSFWQSQDMDCCRNDVQSTITYRLVGDKYNMDPVKRKELCCNVLKKSKFSDTKEVHTKNINNCKNSRDIFSGLEKMKRKNKISCLGSHTTEVQTYRDVKIHHLNTKLKFCKSFKNHTSSFRIDNKTD